MDFIKCNDCLETKKSSEFYENKTTRNRKDGFCKSCSIRKRLARRYGLTVEEYEEIKRTPCGICGELKTKHLRAIDHCHKTGKVRGALCTNCNTGIGMFKEELDLLVKAIEYLVEKNL